MTMKKVLFLCNKNYYLTKMSRVRFHSMEAIAKITDFKWSGPGWEDYDNDLSVQENINNIYSHESKPDIVVAYKPLDLVDFADVEQKTCIRYNEMYDYEWTLKEINERLSFLLNVGLDYLTLSRESGTLSGGEAQRIRLASQIGSGLTGVLYVLDEPSIGLHQKDNMKLIDALKRLRDLGNTVIVVEHDTETIRNADYIIDLGPEGGKKGGNIIFQGMPEDIIKSKKSFTGMYLKNYI